MSFFAVEVDYYRQPTGDAAVIAPRTAFIPSWITGGGGGVRGPVLVGRDERPVSPQFTELLEKMDQLATELGLRVTRAKTGRNYQPAQPEQGVSYTAGVGVYSSSRGAELNLSVFRALGYSQIADDLLHRLRDVSGIAVTAPDWPSVPCEALLVDRGRTRQELLEPYFEARSALPKASPDSAG